MAKKNPASSQNNNHNSNSEGNQHEEEENYARLDDDDNDCVNRHQSQYDTDFGEILANKPVDSDGEVDNTAFTLRTEKLPQGAYDTGFDFDLDGGAAAGAKAGGKVEESMYEVMIDEQERKQMGYFENLVNLHKSSIELTKFYLKLQNAFNKLTKKFSNHATNMANVCGDISTLLSILEQEVKFLVNHKNKIFSKPFHALFSGFKCFLEFELCYEFFLANFDEAQLRTSDIEEILDEEFGQNHSSLDCLLNEVYSQIMSFPILLEHVYAGASSLMDCSVRVEREEPIRLAIMYLNFKNLVFGLEGIKKSFKSANSQKTFEIISKLDLTKDAYKKGKIHSYLQYGQICLISNAKVSFDSSNKMQKAVILLFTDILLIVKKKSGGYEAKFGIPTINFLKSEIYSGLLKLTYYAGDDNKTLFLEGDQIDAINKTIFGSLIKTTPKGYAFNVTVPLGTTCHLCKNFLGGFQAQAWFCQKKYFHKDCLNLPVPIETQMDVFYVSQMPEPTLMYEWKGKKSEITDLFIAPRAFIDKDGQIKVHKVMITKFNGKALQKVPFDGSINAKFMTQIRFRYQGTKAISNFEPKFIESFTEVSFFDSSSQGKKLSRIMSTSQVRLSNPNLMRMPPMSPQKLSTISEKIADTNMKVSPPQPQATNTKPIGPTKSVSAPNLSHVSQKQPLAPNSSYAQQKQQIAPNSSYAHQRQSIHMPQASKTQPYAHTTVQGQNLGQFTNQACSGRQSINAHRSSIKSHSQSMKFSQAAIVNETNFASYNAENSMAIPKPAQYETPNNTLFLKPSASSETFTLFVKNKPYTFVKPEYMNLEFDRKAAENFLCHCDNGIFVMRLSFNDDGRPEAVVISVAQDNQVKHCKIYYMPYPLNYWSLKDGTLNLPDLHCVVKFFRINNMRMVFSTMDVFLKNHLKFDA